MARALIIGLGGSGIAAARRLKTEGWEVILSDRSNSDALVKIQQALSSEGIMVKLGDTPSLASNLPDLIVVSPGVPWDVPFLVEARAQGIDTLGELELAWRYLQSVPWIGVTGTNGKTTTTALIAAMLQAGGLNAPACGNIGKAACELTLPATQQVPLDWIVAEISSYQIESSAALAPTIGVWTTFTPDHLNRHKTLDNYYAIKASLLHRCKHQIINGDDPYLRQLGQQQWPDAYWTSVAGAANLLCDRKQGIYIEDNWIAAFGEVIAPVNLFKMVGKHNLQNLLMAVAAARLAGVEKGAIAKAIATFPGVPHRLEYICTLAGISFINDSKATNYDAAAVGLNSVDAPAILIAGGEAKQGDDRSWIEAIKAKAAFVLLIGQAASTFAKKLQQSGYNHWEIVETMDRAVLRSQELAPPKTAKVVLLSPACASFDQYQSFEQRGDHFRQLCLQLLEKSKINDF